MIIEYSGLKEINGSLVVLDGVKGASYDEMVEIRLDNGAQRTGRIVQIDGERVVVQVFEGTKGISLVNTSTSFKGHPIELNLSPEIMGRVFDGLGRPADGLRFILLKKEMLTLHPSILLQEFTLKTISTQVSLPLML